MFITRDQYNYLIDSYPSWMGKVFPNIIKNWHLLGCKIDPRFKKRFEVIFK